MQKECDNLGNLKNVDDFEEEWDSSTSEGKGRAAKNLKGRIKKLKKGIENGSSGD